MSIESKLSGHWTDDQLIAELYGVGPANGHLARCPECQEKLTAMSASRDRIDARAETGVSSDLLASQRRRIYSRITEPVGWSARLQFRRWASAAAATLVLGGSVLYYEASQRQQSLRDNVSDAQLAQDVSLMSQSPEAQPTAPLQGLFEE